MLEWIRVGLEEIHINMLQFMDDTLFFCKPSLEILWFLKHSQML